VNVLVFALKPVAGLPSQVSPVELSKTHSVLSYEPTNLYTDVGVGVAAGVGAAPGVGVAVGVALGVGVVLVAGAGVGVVLAAVVSVAVPEPPPQAATKHAADKAINNVLA
jgi:hypothetical protein